MSTAFTVPSRLARTTQISANAAEARQRTLRLYREWNRTAPEICAMYTLEHSPAEYRHIIRQRFERNRHVTDVRAIDVLLLKSRQNYQETINLWKMREHVVGIQLEEPKDVRRANMTFLQKFYEGRDENAVIPAASGVP